MEARIDEYSGALMRIEVQIGDITQVSVDAIVNAANNTLLGGGGVDGQIHKIAGPGLVQECAILNGCDTGDAKITKGYNLPAKHVIHTVGPRTRNAAKLAAAYRRSLEVAVENGVKTIAFPSISTGLYNFPIENACPVAFGTVVGFLKDHPQIEKVIFCTFSAKDHRIYNDEFASWLKGERGAKYLEWPDTYGVVKRVEEEE